MKPLRGRTVRATIFQRQLRATVSHQTMASPSTPSASLKLLRCNEIPKEQSSHQTLRLVTVTHPPPTSGPLPKPHRNAYLLTAAPFSRLYR